MLLNELIGKTLAGAVVGYGTNDLAVKMLFRKYFGLGGVVIRTREQFVDNISLLTEQEIIRHESIATEMQLEPFKKIFDEIIQDFCHHHLHEAVPADLKVSEIPGVDATLQSIKTSLLEHIQKPLQEAIHYYSSKISLESLLPEGQKTHITSLVMDQLMASLEQNKELPSLLASLIGKIRESHIHEFVPKESIAQISENVSGIFVDFHLFLKYNYATEITGLIENLIDALSIEELIENIASRFAQKSVKDILGEQTASELPDLLLMEIKKVFLTDLGDDIIQTFLKFLINLLKKEHYTIYDFLGEDLQERMETFFAEELPGLLGDMILWIKTKKEEIDALVDESFRENTRYLLQEWIVDLFVGSVSEQAQIVQEVIHIVNSQDSQQLAQNGAKRILNYLKNTKISDILKNFNEDELLPRLSPLIRRNLTKPIQELKISQFDDFLNRPFQNWVSASRIQSLISGFIHKGLDERLIYTENFSSLLRTNLEKNILQTSEKSFADFIPEEKQQEIAHYAEELLLNTLRKNKEALKETLGNAIEKYIKDKKLSDLSSTGQLKQINEVVLKAMEGFTDKELENIKASAFQKYIVQISEIQNFDTEVGISLKKYLDENLERLLKGQVEKLVKENLTKFSNDRIRDMVEQAMGKELQPISVFGAVLGAITGALLFFMPIYENFWLNSLVSGLAYGITGWGTNWLAIQMIFKPYNPVKIPVIRLNLLFTPGVIVKNKPRFAKSMGDFIGENLLSKSAIEQTVKPRIGELAPLIEKEFSKNEYAIIDRQLQNRKTRLANFLSTRAISYLEQKEAMLIEKIGEMVLQQEQKKLSHLDTTEIESRIEAQLYQSDPQTMAVDALLNRWNRTWEGNPTLQELLPEEVLKSIKEFIPSTVRKLASNLKSFISEKANLEQLEKELVQRILEMTQKKLIDLLGEEQSKKVSKALRDFLHQKLTDESTGQWIFEWIEERLSAEVKPDRRLKDIFGGKMMQFAQENIATLLRNILDQGLEWLQRNKQKIAEDVYDKAAEKTIGAYFYEDTIKKTVIDLADDKMPAFFEKEFYNLRHLISQNLETLGETTLQKTGIKLNRESLKTKISVFLKNHQLIDFVSKLSNIILEERIYQLSVARLLKKDDDGMKALLSNAIGEELEFVGHHLAEAMDKEESQALITEKISRLVLDIFNKMVLPLKLQTLLKDIQPEVIAEFSQKISSLVFEHPEVKKFIPTLIHAFFKGIKDNPIGQNVDLKLLKESLEKIWTESIMEESSKNYLKQLLFDALEQTLPLLSKDIDKECKDYMTTLFAKTGVKTIEDHLKGLIEAISLKEIVEQRIKEMEGDKLEKFFYGFAGKYFTSLINYGFGFGIIFGLAIDFAVIALFYLLG